MVTSVVSSKTVERVLAVLNKSLTQRQIQGYTRLSNRAVRYALKFLITNKQVMEFSGLLDRRIKRYRRVL